MGDSKYLVSVIIPAYNAERFIAQTIESVIAQTHQNLEILVIDDGSSDSTPNIVKYYMEKDARIVLIQQDNVGVAAARNRGIERARGEFIAPIDADDIWFPEYLEAQLPLMANLEVGMVYVWSVLIDEAGGLMKKCQSHLWQGNDYFPLIYRNHVGNASCVLMRRSYVQLIGGYDSSYRALDAQGAEDWDLYLRLAQKFEVRVVPRLLVGYRQVEGSMSTNLEPMRRSVDLMLDRVAQRHPEIDPIIYRWSRSNFACYLAQKCKRAGNHRGVLIYMKNALKLDYFPLLRVGFYKLILSTLLKILFQPVTSMIWPDHHSWLNLKKSLRTFSQSINLFYKEPTLVTLQRRQERAKGRFPWYQYEQFFAWRCDRIRKQAEKSLRTLESVEGATDESNSAVFSHLVQSSPSKDRVTSNDP